jgi:hypothetical protein
MGPWDLVGLGLGTVAVSLWLARRRPLLPPDASWWERSSRTYADWKGSWAPVTVPLGLALAAVGLVLAVAGGN